MLVRIVAMLRDKIRAEAIAQGELRAAGTPIPAAMKRYARISGLLTAAVSGAGGAAILALGFAYGTLYWGALLFMVALAGMGLVQAIVGRHILTRR